MAKKENKVELDDFTYQLGHAANNIESVSMPEGREKETKEVFASPVEETPSAAQVEVSSDESEAFASLVREVAPDSEKLLMLFTRKREGRGNLSKNITSMYLSKDKIGMLKTLKELSGVPTAVILDNVLDYAFSKVAEDLKRLERKHLELKLSKI